MSKLALAVAAGATLLVVFARRCRRPVLEDDLALLLRGTVIQSKTETELEICLNAVMGVTVGGRVKFLEDDHHEPLEAGGVLLLRSGPAQRLPAGLRVVMLPARGFIVPGFVDTHTHAPQFFFAGKGYE